MLKFNIPLCLLCFALLSGCGDGNGFGLFKDDAAKLTQLETSKQIPTLDRTETLAGIDANNNGVRDDIEVYINSLPFNLQQRKILYKQSENLQKTILADKNNNALIKDLATESGLIMFCFFYKNRVDPMDGFNPHQITSKIESMVSNTKPRLKEYLLFAKKLDGSTFSYVEGSEACRQLGL
jgi:hypothetical protein